MLSNRHTGARLLGLALLLLAAVAMSACSRSEQAPPTATAGPAEPVSADALALAGPWEGKILIAGAGLEIQIALTAQDDGWSGTIAVPAQGATGIELHDIRVGPDTLYLEMLSGASKATFDGQMQPDGSISGVFKQSGITGSFELARPQEPAAAEPLPYREEEITFQNGDVTLAGTLTLPAGDGPFPALILLSGSGQQDRDEALPTVPDYKPFREIADTLTQQGVAVLRYDDRDVSGSTGDLAAATSADFADDAEAALRYLQGRTDIDGQQIGMMGHSEGGILAAMVAARNPDVSFVISMAGTAVDGYQTILKQVERLALASGVSQTEADIAVVQQREVLELAMNQDWTGLETTLNQIAQDQAAAMTDEQRAALGDVGALVKQQIAAQLQIFQSPWYQFFLRHDPGQDWTQVTVPVLGIFGARDTQVDAEQNSAALQAALDQAGNSVVTITVLPAANHLFQEAGTGGVDEYAALPPQLMPEFLEALSQWLLERVQAPS
ncbi:MAG: alpha/beta fold hydrolase [Anaerolineae bacterium]